MPDHCENCGDAVLMLKAYRTPGGWVLYLCQTCYDMRADNIPERWRFVRYLVEHGYLTDYPAERILTVLR